MSNLPKTSTNASATTPSEEFPYTWIDLHKGEVGLFFRCFADAKKDAVSNFLNFSINCNVIIVQARSGTLSPVDSEVYQTADEGDEDDEDARFQRTLKRKKKWE